MTAAQQIRWKQQTVNVHYPMFIAGHSLLRFSPCYKMKQALNRMFGRLQTDSVTELRQISEFARLAFSYNVLQLTDSFCFSQKFWLGAVI